MTQVTNDTRRLAAEEVRPLTDELIDWLGAYCERIEIGGSLRRGRDTVKDVELIVLNPALRYFEELDTAVSAGTIAKKLYGATKTTRWGAKYRGLLYRGITFELFCCDSDNAGYITALRTGPAEANEYLVTQLKYRCKTWRLDKGYCWATYSSLELPPQKLSVPTEADFFALCGLPHIPPQERTEALYRRLLGARGHTWGDVSNYLAEAQEAAVAPAQAGLFDDAITPAAPVSDEARAAEDAYRAIVGTRSYDELADEARERGCWIGVYCYEQLIAKARGEGCA